MKVLLKNILVRNINEDRDLLKYNRKYRPVTEELDLDFNEDEENDEVDDLIDEADAEIDRLAEMFDLEDTDNDEVVEGSLFEDNETESDTDADNLASQSTMTDEELKDESLKIAINVAKLMTNVQANDIITIAGTIADFIRNHEIGKADINSLASDENNNESEDDDIDDDMNALFGDEESSDAVTDENIMNVDTDADLLSDDENPFEE